jgi:DNA-binding MarR family transcriptional regulator
MKQEFIEFLDALMRAAPEVVEEKGSETIMAYIEAMRENTKKQESLTENGARVLAFLQTADSLTFKAKDIGEALGVASRTVSGALRKLVNDGFVDKMGENPTIYSLTEKGKNYNITEGEN